MPIVLCKTWKFSDKAHFTETQHILCQRLIEVVPCAQPSLASLLIKPKMGMHENIFEFNGGNKRKLHSYFPDPTMDIDNKVCSQLQNRMHCHASALNSIHCRLSNHCAALWRSMHPDCAPWSERQALGILFSRHVLDVLLQLRPPCLSGSSLRASDAFSVHAAGPGNIAAEVQARHARVMGGPQGMSACLLQSRPVSCMHSSGLHLPGP